MSPASAEVPCPEYALGRAHLGDRGQGKPDRVDAAQPAYQTGHAGPKHSRLELVQGFAVEF